MILTCWVWFGVLVLGLFALFRVWVWLFDVVRQFGLWWAFGFESSWFGVARWLWFDLVWLFGFVGICLFYASRLGFVLVGLTLVGLWVVCFVWGCFILFGFGPWFSLGFCLFPGCFVFVFACLCSCGLCFRWIVWVDSLLFCWVIGFDLCFALVVWLFSYYFGIDLVFIICLLLPLGFLGLVVCVLQGLT